MADLGFSQGFASAPGKVLIAGGYLVLEKPHFGLVVALDARFYCFCELQLEENNHEGLHIDVISPQLNIKWSYFAGLSNESDSIDVHLEPAKDQSKNPFVESALRLSLVFIANSADNPICTAIFKERSRIGYLRLILFADNSFYSHREELLREGKPVTKSNLESLPQFSVCVNSSGSFSKTGLGSSAALTVSLIASIFQVFGLVTRENQSSEESLQILHNMSQLVHCIAQGKVGSGFDISAAIFGSQKYFRFSPEILADAVTLLTPSTLIHTILNQSIWDSQQLPFSLPPGVFLVLGDIAGGSETPFMVRKVLAWKNESELDNGALGLWNSIALINSRVAQLFDSIAQETQSASFLSRITQLEDMTAEQWSQMCDQNSQEPIHRAAFLLSELHRALQEMRLGMKNMGDLAQVPIEPEEQSLLLDATLSVPGVIGVAVPGAGGYDAVYALVLGERAIERVEDFWESWNQHGDKPFNVCALPVTQSSTGLLFHEDIESFRENFLKRV